ncbi:MAG: AMP-binding protein [Ignavibacteriales bacterium]|nr:AMP-binding protein [Ignavibacteriales bacterium]
MFLNFDNKNVNKTAVVDDSGNKATYGELISFRNLFYSKIQKRTLIFILVENSLPALSGFLASVSNRIVPLLLSSNINSELLDRLINIYKPEFIWAQNNEMLNQKYANIFEYFNYVLFKTEFQDTPLYDELSLLLPTSGSTGSSKLVRHSYENLSFSAENVAELFELDENHKAIAFLPIQYTMGLSVVMSHLYAGATVLLIKSALTEKKFWDFVKDNEATSFTGVPFSFEILHKLRFFRMNLPHLKILSQGGGKLSEKLFFEFAQYARDTGKKFIATYGQTEGTARMAYLQPDFALKKIGSIGKAIPNGELSIIDAEGNTIDEPVTQGELVYKGKNVTLGYAYCSEDLVKADERLGVLKTGDLVKRDSEGYYFIIGRLSRFLKLYGFRISLDEVENLIRNHFNIECACSGTDEKMFIHITEENKSQDVLDFVIQKTNLFPDAFKIKVIAEIPKNETGKILYNDLEECG